ncbi:hypothetical protein DICPUDRAFT_84689 [Dictyostelium purpureum]|uniref:G domain-containing protein n=1 Tax=Dictyostelium purpureum TaxID=5786 RepID=F1A3F4_DICPU|nr:uncharacterized protein DICPUDRAFT_84689 [Dictyostelium purpureum]EGC29277.1 hypothetical protein DICPUDRAFT_84689 [Dictyostelium purpureum]|eukprot:XP_003294199.1 hypothetical protein DICPUDRAFT_84689 [Dictyostelium purpureum]
MTLVRYFLKNGVNQINKSASNNHHKLCSFNGVFRSFTTSTHSPPIVNEDFKTKKIIAKDLQKQTLRSMEDAYDIMDGYNKSTYPVKSPLSSSLGSFKESIEQLKDSSFLLVVVGEFNSGKSSFLNALLGNIYLKEGITPTTHRINIIEFGDKITSKTVPSRLSNTEHEIITLPVEWLKDFSLVDTPGTNAVIEGHQEITEHFVPKSDLVLFVTSIDRAFSESEKQFLEKVKKWGKKIVVVISKTDLIDNNPLSNNPQEELNEVIKFVEDNFKSQLGVSPIIFPLSSKLALKAKLQLSGTSILNPNQQQSQSQQVNYNNLLSATSVSNNYSKSTQKFYEELNQNQQWKNSRFFDLENYILQTLDSNERIKLKLLNPLGVADKLYNEFEEEFSSQRNVLDFDFENINQSLEQISEHQKDLQRDLDYHLERIDTILLRMENRANAFLDDEIQFSNIFNILKGDAIKNQFEKKVIDGTNQEIETLVRDLVDIVVDKNMKRWKVIMDLINQKSSNKSQKVIGVIKNTRDTSDFSTNRQKTIQDMGSRTAKALSSYDKENESTNVSKDIKNAIYQTILFEAGTVGVATILSTTLLDITGILGFGALAVTGLAWVPFKKVQLKRSINSKISNLRVQLKDTISDRIGDEIRGGTDKIQDGIQPYVDFTQSESKKITDMTNKINEFKKERQSLVYEVDKYFK